MSPKFGWAIICEFGNVSDLSGSFSVSYTVYIVLNVNLCAQDTVRHGTSVIEWYWVHSTITETGSFCT